jgi:hypothetical protein
LSAQCSASAATTAQARNASCFGQFDRVADVVALLFGEHADRAQPNHGGFIDEAFGADDVPDQVPIALLGAEGERRMRSTGLHRSA